MKTAFELLRLLTLRYPPHQGHHAFTFLKQGLHDEPVLVVHIMMKDDWRVIQIPEEDLGKSAEVMEAEIVALLATQPS